MQKTLGIWKRQTCNVSTILNSEHIQNVNQKNGFYVASFLEATENCTF